MRLHFFLIIIMLTACRKEVTIPKDVLSQEKMAEILVEFHLLEAKIDLLNISMDSATEVYRHFEPQVYSRYEVDSVQYRESLAFYMDNPALMHSIYETVVDSLMLREKNNRID